MWFIIIMIVSFVCGIIFGIIENKHKKQIYISQEDSVDIFDEFAEHQHSGRCEGDCSKCPAHYGYRHGRWYYGHDHSEGCEFGGNKCGGGL
jgi:hypothetical protein